MSRKRLTWGDEARRASAAPATPNEGPASPAHKPEFNQDKTYIFYCASGGRSAMAAQVAMDMGLSPVVNLTGGISAWTKAGGPLDQG